VWQFSSASLPIFTDWDALVRSRTSHSYNSPLDGARIISQEFQTVYEDTWYWSRFQLRRQGMSACIASCDPAKCFSSLHKSPGILSIPWSEESLLLEI
jgi:hypothetical protein